MSCLWNLRPKHHMNGRNTQIYGMPQSFSRECVEDALRRSERVKATEKSPPFWADFDAACVYFHRNVLRRGDF
ncbi:uncharacterized protein STEHIDRAFT_118842 [Stereum hirsutum FP-91666 SS1]|uniref:uncharacterized protein n=1 Tax=Stereum hirsutum (strain FP-91666) TaxID=721885 RepID=UPI0004410111|nr:uncharacterized protein STEHIDRAFT_118842 [Stereum hirsutum FP-91666 SS1]EIM89721.1 hypothetical protein STEHIDRAFT_118842 [Stereum hirsutum FP-91666 SS1]